jgi:flagellar hook protein FlgE
MSNTYYTSLTGMMAASFGLQNTSNNLANMESPGYKRSDIFYSTLGNSAGLEGLGVSIGGKTINFNAGNYLPTNNPTDLAITGNGFFVVKLKNGELQYTRNGEFGFNKEGLLIDKHSEAIVQGYDQQGRLTPIEQFGPQYSEGKATKHIYLKGELIAVPVEKIPNDPNPLQSNYEPVSFTITIFDAQGKVHTITIKLEVPGQPGKDPMPFADQNWSISEVTCDDATISFDPQSIEFDSNINGSAKEGRNLIKLLVNGDQSLNLHFGEFRSNADESVKLNKDKDNKNRSRIETYNQDGFAKGEQIGFSFDDNGLLSYHYNNGQTIDGTYIALATFRDPNRSLSYAQNNLFRAKDITNPKLGKANHSLFGSIKPQYIETANIDSTTEFSRIVVLQRMFQACSQMMEIDKQLLEDLYKK